MNKGLLEAIHLLKVGDKILKDYEEQMKTETFDYKDFKRMQNNYERIMRGYIIQAYNMGLNNLSEAEFNEWLNEVSLFQKEDLDKGLSSKQEEDK